MSMFTVTDASQVFHLSDEAAAKVKSLIEQEQGADELVLRVAVAPGGCSGYSYEMFFDTDVAPDDLQLEQAGVRVVIDPASQQLLKGASQRRGVPLRHQQPVKPVLDELRNARDIGGDHWNFHGHGFYQHVRYAIAVSIVENLTGESKDATFVVDLSQLLLGDRAIHENCILKAQLYDELLDKIRVFIGLADKSALKGVASIFQGTARLNQVGKALLLYKAADRQKEWDGVIMARQGWCEKCCVQSMINRVD